jgi:cobalt-zinc-cadmium resistance protein CzcA
VPTLSELDIALHSIRIPSTGLSQSTEMQFAVERAVSEIPEVAFAFSKTGTAEMASDPMPVNVSDGFVILKPRDQWPDPSLTKEEVRGRIERRVESLVGNNYEFTQPIQMRFNELIAGVRGEVAIKVFGDDFDTLLPGAEQITAILQSTGSAAEVRAEQIKGLPVLSVDVNRSAIARYGLSVSDVQDVVSIAVGGREAGQVFEGDRRFDLMVRLPESFRRDIRTLRNLPVTLPSETGEFEPPTNGAEPPARFALLPLDSVADVQLVEGPNSGEPRERQAAHRRAGQRARPGHWLVRRRGAGAHRARSEAPRDAALAALRDDGLHRCPARALGGDRDALAARDAILHLGRGGLHRTLRRRGAERLVMVSFINELRERGRPLDAAIREGALTRLRPVLMTALVASLGFFPMALATGTGAEVQRPLATVVIGGLVSSTALTLLVLPALYCLFTPRGRRAPPPEEIAL